ncbi:MAG TPA: CDP-glucose 4,6-dehydratase [Caldimonas sp.]|nr:CDP-glucose 4,6-dehydratase [Caldimonas sp.]HEX2542300.1 CDP-glucose 4,6-dehydratase [Caldimonas sp.]
MSEGFWRGRSVLVTGHTGFKGGWLSLWLTQAGAKVHGYSLQPPTEPNLFGVARIAERLAGHTMADIRDAAALRRAVEAARPEVVFHLAAQPLVRQSYADPVETYSVNVMGTVHLLEAVRAVQGVKAVVNVTTDKCYENREWVWGYRESEPLGGHDPYSNSKACSELVSAAYRNSFLAAAGIALATARAGNVIGGGDWAVDRLVPDFFRAASDGLPLEVRYPRATRPWQHVLEPVGGYLLLAEQLATGGEGRAEAWNFGPPDDDARTVAWILDRLVERSPGTRWNSVAGEHVHEANFLKLDSSKARAALGWKPRWNLGTALDKTVEWHNAWRRGDDMQQVCLQQIGAYLDATEGSR